MSSPEAEQPRCSVSRIEQPLLEGVITRCTHEAGLAWEEVQSKQRRIVCVPDDGVQPPLLQIPNGHHARTAACCHEGDAGTWDQFVRGSIFKGPWNRHSHIH